jgi:hypothetical protein
MEILIAIYIPVDEFGTRKDVVWYVRVKFYLIKASYWIVQNPQLNP